MLTNSSGENPARTLLQDPIKCHTSELINDADDVVHVPLLAVQLQQDPQTVGQLTEIHRTHFMLQEGATAGKSPGDKTFR